VSRQASHHLLFFLSSAILTPTDGGPSERAVTLGQLIGRIKNGGAAAAALQGFKEDRRNAAKSVQPLYYGAFSSYGPAYDSTFANLTKQASHCSTSPTFCCDQYFLIRMRIDKHDPDPH
jgi:hypothetical protein